MNIYRVPLDKPIGDCCMFEADVDGGRCLREATHALRFADETHAPACGRHAGRADSEAVEALPLTTSLRKNDRWTIRWGLPELVEESAPLVVGQPGAPAMKRWDTRPSWDEYFWIIAEAVSERADCTRRRVGAVLVGPDHRVLSTGYNGAPAGVPGCASAGACPRGKKTTDEVPSRSDYASGEGACIALHAEWNAVMYARPKSRRDATLYVTIEPCPQCYALLEAVGITDVRWPKGID